MKLKNEIFARKNFVESLNSLLEIEMPADIAYKIAVMASELRPKEDAYKLAKLKIIKKYGNIKGDRYEIDNKYKDKANIEFADLLSVEQEYAFDVVKLPKDVRVQSKVLLALKGLIEV